MSVPDFVCAPISNFDKETMTVKYSEAHRGSVKNTKSDDSPALNLDAIMLNNKQVKVTSDSEPDNVDFMDSQMILPQMLRKSSGALQVSTNRDA